MELMGRLQTANETARQKLTSHKVKSKDHYNKITESLTLEVSQKVLLFDVSVHRG